MKKSMGLCSALLLLFVSTAIAGGGHPHGEDGAHLPDDSPMNAVTFWTEYLELYLEFPQLAVKVPG